MKRFLTILLLLSIQVAAEEFKIPKNVASVLEKFCTACHDADIQKGNFRLDNLDSLNHNMRLDILNNIQEQVYLNQMPPEKKKQPSKTERDTVVKWISQELKKHNASRFSEKLKKPEYGNYLDHEKLFSGEFKDLKPFTFDRRWLVSDYIFEARVKELFNFYRSPLSYKNLKLANPFLLPKSTGVRYYANETLNSGTLLTMMKNSKDIADEIFNLKTKSGKKNNSVAFQIIKEQKDFETVINTRKDFVDKFIEELCGEIYGNKDKSFLPPFAKSKDLGPPDQKTIKKGKFRIGEDQYPIVFSTYAKFRDIKKHEDLIKRCEEYWFFRGHSSSSISSRIQYMNYYKKTLPSLAKGQFKRYSRSYPYKYLESKEMSRIKDTILKLRKKGDNYTRLIEKCHEFWDAELENKVASMGPVDDKTVTNLLKELMSEILKSGSSQKDIKVFTDLAKSYFADIGRVRGVKKVIQTLLLRSDLYYRYEFGEGQVDKFGRRMLSPVDASYAISYALTDNSPDKNLLKAAQSGKLNSREDYKREVTRLLKSKNGKSLRFFREFFGYYKMGDVFKDNKRFGGHYEGAAQRLLEDADMLVSHILKEDKNVFEELLTTDKFYVLHSGNNEEMKREMDNVVRIYNYFKNTDWKKLDQNQLKKHVKNFKKLNITGLSKSGKREAAHVKGIMSFIGPRLKAGAKSFVPYTDSSYGSSKFIAEGKIGNPAVLKFYDLDFRNWDYPVNQPAKIPNRKGILTHPAWLIAFSHNAENDPVLRGKWIREKLLADRVPDVPVTVEAQLPIDHTKSLRERLVIATEKNECWKCHKQMNPLGVPFESFDDFGRFREKESLEDEKNLVKKVVEKGPVHHDSRDIFKTVKVNPAGFLKGTGDSGLDGEVKDAFDLIDRLAKSKRVRQSIIRHAFRYYMGRNEQLSDSKTLIDAENAYVKSGGSFKAVVISLLTSDSFIYRKPLQEI